MKKFNYTLNKIIASEFNIETENTDILSDEVEAYLQVALETSTDDDGNILDNSYYIDDFSTQAVSESSRDIEDFIDMVAKFFPKGQLPENSVSMIVKDFWLTRNGHGAGFLDGRYNEKLAQKLYNAAKSFGGVSIYVHEDGKLYIA